MKIQSRKKVIREREREIIRRKSEGNKKMKKGMEFLTSVGTEVHM